MNRRDFLKRLSAAGMVAASSDILVPERKFWQLDRTMASPDLIRGGISPTSDSRDLVLLSVNGEISYWYVSGPRYGPYQHYESAVDGTVIRTTVDRQL